MAGRWEAGTEAGEVLVLRIKDWNKHFETAQSRKVQGPLPWFRVQTKHDGKGYKKLMRFENGTALYGSWILIAAIAAKAPVRGYLIDSDGPLTADDISLKTDAPTDLITQALAVLIDNIGWIEAIECHSIAQLVSEWGPDTTAISKRGAREEKSREDTQVSSPTSSSSQESSDGEALNGLHVIDIYAKLTIETLRDRGKLREWFLWQASLPAVAVSKSIDEAWEWCCHAAVQALAGDKPIDYFKVLFVKDGRRKGKKRLESQYAAAGRALAKGAA